MQSPHAPAVAAATAAVITLVIFWYKGRRRFKSSDVAKGQVERPVAHLIESEPLMGQDKWLGGVLGSDGCVYGVPGHAKTVLRIDPACDSISTHRRSDGASLTGKYKWLRGNLHPDGAIYCIPCHASTVLKIDCTAYPPRITEIGGPHPGEWKWHGAVLSPHDQCIYGIPQFAEAVLKIDPLHQTTCEIGGPFPGASPTGKHKWYGGLLGGDGCIYGIPQCATSVLKIDPFTQTTSMLGELDAGGWKWHGGVVGRDGCIYGIPANADSVLKIDPFAQLVTTIPFTYRCHHRQDRKYKYLGGVLGPDNRIYCIPSDADYVLRIDPANGTAVEIGPEIGTRATHCHISHNCNKWQNGFLAPDGLIYAIPLKASAILRIDPMSDEVDVCGGPFPGFEKWEGGVLSRQGAMYCMPLKSKQVLKINPTGKGIARICDEDMSPELSTVGQPVENDEYPPPDRLLHYLSTHTELGCKVVQSLQTDGYVVLPNVLSALECATELERMWSFVTTVSPGVRRDAPQTWYPATEGAPDPWPHSGWRSFSDMMQTHHAGWLFSELRVLLAERVFAPLFGTHKLHASKEGFSFHRPTGGEHGMRHPVHHRQTFVCGTPSRTAGEHFDQGASEVGLQHIQSAAALLDQDVDDACFLCWPRSYEHHQRLVADKWRGRSHWVPLTDMELNELRDAGLSPKRLPVSRGSVILWRSDLVHCGAAPKAPTDNFRAVVYAAMQPACLTPRNILTRKVEAYQRRLTGDHVPSRENWHTNKAPPATSAQFRPYFADSPPKLSARMAELYGLVAYDGADAPKAAHLHDTPT